MIVVGGLSGAGKSIALNTLEDLGYYCIDNLPISLTSELKKIIDESKQPIAVGISIHNTKIADIELLKKLKEEGIISQLLFLDADNNELIKRYNESRRKHPLADGNNTLIEAIEEERKHLNELIALSDININTSQLNVYDLSNRINEWLDTNSKNKTLVSISSFGFKNGIPNNSDLLYDVRFLPNPHWIESLREFNGNDDEVVEFLSSYPVTLNYINDVRDFLEKWLPIYMKSNRAYLTISIGCTGGKHRSVYVAEKLALALQLTFSNIKLRHRDMPLKKNRK